jgi:hypothetical protein
MHLKLLSHQMEIDILKSPNFHFGFEAGIKKVKLLQVIGLLQIGLDHTRKTSAILKNTSP